MCVKFIIRYQAVMKSASKTRYVIVYLPVKERERERDRQRRVESVSACRCCGGLFIASSALWHSGKLRERERESVKPHIVCCLADYARFIPVNKLPCSALSNPVPKFTHFYE